MVNASTIPELFATQAARFRERRLFLVKREGRYQEISWADAEQQVIALAAWLLQQGVAVGDRVVLFCENRPEWAIADLAVQSVGAWIVPIYPSLTPRDLLPILSDCEPVIAIASDSQQVAKLQAVQGKLACLRTIIGMGAQPSLGNVVLWDHALEEGRGQSAHYRDTLVRRRAALKPTDTCTLIYTSGTTGEPKGVMLSHRNFLSNVEACHQVIPQSESDLHLSFLPLCHVFERMAGWYLMLACGGSIAYAQSMETIRENMLEVRPTTMLGMPRFFEKLHDRIQGALKAAPASKRRLIERALSVGREYAEASQSSKGASPFLKLKYALADRIVFKKIKARLGGRLRFFVSGSAPLSESIAYFFLSVGVVILEGYGLTETSPVICVNRLPVPKIGTVGLPLPGVEVRIAEDGEILTRGPHVMQGYFKKTEATEATIRDGWLYTGDIGQLDGQGRLKITDRKRDLIKTAGGKFIPPQKLESLFTSDSCIAQALVFGDRQRYCVALIVPESGELKRQAQQQCIAGSPKEWVRDARIQDFYWKRIQQAQQDLAAFEQVKCIALLPEAFTQEGGELTPTMKIKRRIIAERHADLLQSLYASSKG